MDNASSPPVELPTEGGALPPNCRVVRQPRVGLTYARETGMHEARGELWISVDDDNVLDPGYLAVASAFMTAHPEVGALGGRIIAEFAAPAPAWLLTPDHAWRLALRDFGPEVLISTARTEALRSYPHFAPIGAGMILRRTGIERYLQWAEQAEKRLTDRQGGHLGTCGDSELVMQTTLLAQLEVAYSPALSMLHLIPETRLRYRYLRRLTFQGAATWAEFQCRYGYDKPISRVRAVARCVRAFFFLSAWSPDRFIQWCDTCGYNLSLARQK